MTFINGRKEMGLVQIRVLRVRYAKHSLRQLLVKTPRHYLQRFRGKAQEHKYSYFLIQMFWRDCLALLESCFSTS
jgi:hypothetical protein